MIKKNIFLLIACLFFVAIITSACGGSGKTTSPNNSSLYYLLASQNANNSQSNNNEENNGNNAENNNEQANGEEPDEQSNEEQENEPVPDPEPTPVNPFAEAQEGDEIEFGNYPQTTEGEVQPIKWRVLSRDDDKKELLAVSVNVLDSVRFDSSSNNWANSEIRSWLNGDGFYNGVFNGTVVFTEEEKSFIKPVVLTDVNMTESDNVFLLSNGEANAYFADNSARMCQPTDYAVAKGVVAMTSEMYAGSNCLWWLRTAYSSSNVSDVNYVGKVNFYSVNSTDPGVRPALWINL